MAKYFETLKCESDVRFWTALYFTYHAACCKITHVKNIIYIYICIDIFDVYIYIYSFFMYLSTLCILNFRFYIICFKFSIFYFLIFTLQWKIWSEQKIWLDDGMAGKKSFRFRPGECFEPDSLHVAIGNFGHNLNLKFKCDQVRNRQPLPQSVKQAMAMSIFIWLLWLKTSLGHRAL